MASKTFTGNDNGTIFAEPKLERRKKTLKDGTTVLAYHQAGVIVSENPESPWHEATFFAQGTIVAKEDGTVVQEVALCETVDADGDLTWSILWGSPDGPDAIDVTAGTGKWKGISGEGTLSDSARVRADGYTMPAWEMGWSVNPDAEVAPLDPSAYAYHDTGLSFHGPHFNDFAKELTTGYTLVVNNQSGVLISENPDAVSPRHLATNFDRGTTVKSSEGKTLGDAMLLEDTDPDGDIVWLYHEWWYGEGGGIYRFIGGTGKWQGISGEGQTLGILKDRTDDHFMLRSEIFWNLG